MIKHIVMWTLKESITGQARTDALQRIKDSFEALPGRIPGLLAIEIGFDFSQTPESADLILYSEFESRAALEGYAGHPLHTALMPLVRDIRVDRRVGDYER
jgi:Stress responsive A/B Barrel Domain